MKRHLDALEMLDRVGREDRLALSPCTSRSRPGTGSRRPRRVAVLAAVDRVAAAVLHAQQLVDALVELVVAHAVESRPIRLKASIVGSSWNRADTSGVAPIRSPAETKSVFGLVARRASTCVARYSAPPAEWCRSDRLNRWTARARGCPWKSLRPRIWTWWSLRSSRRIHRPVASPMPASRSASGRRWRSR